MSMLADIEDDIASTYVMEQEAEFIEKVRSTTEVQRESKAKSLKNRLPESRNAVNVLDP